MQKKRITNVRNEHGIEVCKMCASCQHKSIQLDGIRICELTQLVVDQHNKCKKWQMANSLQNAGKSGGVVKNKDTKEIVIR